MKKVFSLLLVVALMMSLSVSALAAENNEHVYEFKADAKPSQCEVSGELPGADKWFATRYGFVQLNSDGTFLYKADANNEELQKEHKNGWAVVDDFIITFTNAGGGWEGREIKISIQPEGIKGRGYYTDYKLTDLDETLEGTALTDKQTTSRTALRVGHGRIELTEDGYTYTHYPFLDVSKALPKGNVNTQIIPILCGDEITEVTVRTIGVAPYVQSHRIYITSANGYKASGNVLTGSKLGYGTAAEHKLSLDSSMASNILSLSADGNYTFQYDGNWYGSEFLFFTYTDKKGNEAHGYVEFIVTQAVCEAYTAPNP